MGIVNPPQVHPGIFRALYRVCAERGPDFAATIDEFVGLLAPPAIVREGADPQSVARLSVKEAVAIGMLQPVNSGTEHRLGLAVSDAGTNPSGAEALFTRELRRLIMAIENNGELMGEQSSAEEGAEREQNERLSTTQAREFTRIQAWLLMRDPTAPSLFFTHKDDSRHVQRLQNRYKGVDLVVNGNRWTNFRRWSLFLGFSRQDQLAGTAKAGIVPDPTRAVRDEIESIGQITSVLPLVDLRSRIAEVLPVLDGGQYRTAVRRHVGGEEDERRVSPALALALLRCERANLLRFEARADFGGGTLTLGTRAYTHVHFGEA